MYLLVPGIIAGKIIIVVGPLVSAQLRPEQNFILVTRFPDGKKRPIAAFPILIIPIASKGIFTTKANACLRISRALAKSGNFVPIPFAKKQAVTQLMMTAHGTSWGNAMRQVAIVMENVPADKQP